MNELLFSKTLIVSEDGYKHIGERFDHLQLKTDPVKIYHIADKECYVIRFEWLGSRDDYGNCSEEIIDSDKLERMLADDDYSYVSIFIDEVNEMKDVTSYDSEERGEPELEIINYEELR